MPPTPLLVFENLCEKRIRYTPAVVPVRLDNWLKPLLIAIVYINSNGWLIVMEKILLNREDVGFVLGYCSMYGSINNRTSICAIHCRREKLLSIIIPIATSRNVKTYGA